MGRFLATLQVSWRSSFRCASVGTAVTSLLLIPVLSVLYDTLISNDLGAPNLARTGYAAATVAVLLTTCGGVVAKVIGDRHLGVFQEVHVRRTFDAGYWLASGITSAAFALPVGCMLAIGVTLTIPGASFAELLRALAVLVVATVNGMLLGVAAAGFGVALPNPYGPLNLLTAALPILAGVIVPSETYPVWLRWLAAAVPGDALVRANEAAGAWPLLARDVAVALVWAAAGILAVRVAMRRIRRGEDVGVL